ncbi:MAG: hypothetical protein V1838_00585 [Patescibacteria group bacterium]
MKVILDLQPQWLFYELIYAIYCRAVKERVTIGDPEESALYIDPEFLIEQQAPEALVKMNGLPAVVRILKNKRLNKVTRGSLADDVFYWGKYKLIKGDVDTVFLLGAGLKDKKLAEYQRHFFRALAQVGMESDIPKLLEILKQEQHIHWKADLAESLCNLDSEEVIEPVIEVFFAEGLKMGLRNAIINLANRNESYRRKIIVKLMETFRERELLPVDVKQIVKIIGRTIQSDDPLRSQSLREIEEYFREFDDDYPKCHLENVHNLRCHIAKYLN